MSQSNALSAALLLQQLHPDRLRTMAMTLPLAEFVAAFPDAPILLVKLDGPGAELETGLSMLKSQPDRELNVLAFHTLLGESITPAASEPVPANAAELRRRLSQARHFAITLEKRVVDGSYEQRITVGRARNKDIVLRHVSVSKFHAWFERDETGLRLADADSSNGTRKNESELQARELTPVQPGDILRFGAIEATLCTPDALWRALSI